MRRVRRPSLRRGPRRSFLANVNPDSINLSSVSRNIKGKLKQIKNYQVPKFDTSTAYHPADEQEQRDGAYGGNRYVKDTPQDLEERLSSYTNPNEDTVQQQQPQQQQNIVKDANGVAYVPQVPSYANVAHGATVGVAQNNAYVENKPPVAVVNLNPDEKYILSTAGANRPNTTIEKYNQGYQYVNQVQQGGVVAQQQPGYVNGGAIQAGSMVAYQPYQQQQVAMPLPTTHSVVSYNSIQQQPIAQQQVISGAYVNQPVQQQPAQVGHYCSSCNHHYVANGQCICRRQGGGICNIYIC